MPIKRVQPGDFITADFINQIIDEVNRLGQEVSALGQKRRVAKASAKKAGGRKKRQRRP